MTKRETYEAMLTLEGIAGNEEFTDFIKHEIELLDNKKNTPKKPTKNQQDNEKHKEAIIDYLGEVNAPMTIKDIQAGIETFKGFTNQKITRLLIDLRKAGLVKRTYKKKVAYFELGNENEDVAEI